VKNARPHRAEPMGAEEMVGEMDRAGVDRAIIVPPSPVGDENLTALEAVARYPERFAIMGRFNPEAPDAESRLESWLEQPGMLGIRMTFHKPQWQSWLDGDEIEWYWSGCERLGIPLMIFVPNLVEKAAALAQRHPGLKLILDHMARDSALRDDAAFADLDKLLALRRFENVAVKISAVPCYSTQPYPFANLTPYLERIYGAFGPRRLMWGSDITRLPCTYSECLDHFRYELAFLGDEDKDWILGKTLAEWLGWPA
jgi:L-fuconolactonase